MSLEKCALQEEFFVFFSFGEALLPALLETGALLLRAESVALNFCTRVLLGHGFRRVAPHWISSVPSPSTAEKEPSHFFPRASSFAPPPPALPPRLSNSKVKEKSEKEERNCRLQAALSNSRREFSPLPGKIPNSPTTLSRLTKFANGWEAQRMADSIP